MNRKQEGLLLDMQKQKIWNLRIPKGNKSREKLKDCNRDSKKQNN